MMLNRKGMTWNVLAKWLIALALLIVALLIYGLISGQSHKLADFINMIMGWG